MKSNFRAGELRTKIRVPRERRILSAIACAFRRETQRAAGQIKEIGLAQYAILQFQDDQIFCGGDFSERVPRRVPFLRLGWIKEQKTA